MAQIITERLTERTKMGIEPKPLLWRTKDTFPYAKYKPNQVALISFIQRYPKVLVHAPTGFGKTPIALSSLLPFVRSDQKPSGSQLIVFTRTKTQIFQVYFRELARIVGDRKKH